MCLHTQPICHSFVHGMSEELDVVSPKFFGPIHRDICVFEQDVWGQAICRVDSNANTASGENFIAFNLEGCLDHLDQAMQYSQAHVFIQLSFQDEDKFISSKTSYGIGIPDCLFQASGYFGQEKVTGIMAESIVNEFESVQVKKCYPKWIAATVAIFHCLTPTVLQQDAVWQASQMVILRFH